MNLLGNIQTTTQEHLDIEDIRENLVVCKNGQVSLILETTAVNFDLLSEMEQEAKILAFAQLINSLNFYMQILVRTERTDVTKYIELLQEEERKNKNNALKRQMEIYIEFIKNLTVNNEVLDKRFFIIISSLATSVIKTNPFKQLFGKEEKIVNIVPIVERATGILMPRRDHLIKQLQRMNIFARQLDTDELIKLFYASYNPDTPGLQKLQIKASEIEAPIIQPMLKTNQTGLLTNDILNTDNLEDKNV